MESAVSYASRVEKALGSRVIQKQPLGRDGLQALWIEMKHLTAAAAALGPGVLEALTVFQLEDALVFTYLVRSEAASEGLVALRSSVKPVKSVPPIVPSVRRIWPAATPFERELSEAFGIRFGEDPPKQEDSA